MSRLTDEEKGWRNGAAITLALLVRFYDQPAVAAWIMKELGLTIAKLQSAGVEEYDLEPIRKAMRENA